MPDSKLFLGNNIDSKTTRKCPLGETFAAGARRTLPRSVIAGLALRPVPFPSPEVAVVNRCLQLNGGYGYMLDYPIARVVVDSQVGVIPGGANQILGEIIGCTRVAGE